MAIPAGQTSADVGGAAVDRFVARHPELSEPVQELLQCGSAVRAAKLDAYGSSGLPQPRQDARSEQLHVAVEAVLLELEGELASDPVRPAEIEDRIGAVCEAFARLRVAAHRFAPARKSSSLQALRELVASRDAFGRAFRRLEREAHARHVRKLPWQLELASHVDPTAPVVELELTGYDLPGTPAAAKPWGERCFLTGSAFNTDSRRRPRLRYRSLDSRDHVLCERAYGWVGRFRRALEAARGIAPGGVELAATEFPLLFEEYVQEAAHPSFSRLGLLDFPSLAVGLNNMLRTWANRPLFGSRDGAGAWPTLGVADRTATASGTGASGYTWVSYDGARRRALRLARGLERLGLSPGDSIGVLLHENRIEFYLSEMAAVLGLLVPIGLLPSFADHLAVMLRETTVRVLITDRRGLELLEGMAVAELCPVLETIVVVAGEGELAASSAGSKIDVVRFEDLERGAEEHDAGRAWRSASGIGFGTEPIFDDGPGWRRAAELGIEPDADDAPFTVLFTSGSTGRPKGTMITKRRWAEEMCLRAEVWPHVAVSFQPSALAADRSTVWRALFNGGRVGFASRGARLFSDVRAIRPTLFDVPPVIWNTIYTRYKEALADATLDATEAARIRQRFRGFLGGRLAMMGAGGAAADPGVSRAMESIFGIPMFEGYGTTEAGFIAMNGVLFAGLDYRLVDRPELGLTSSDRPFPRGELAVRTPRTGSGYVADEESSRDAFTDDGYFLTGDLVEIRPGRKVRILGRRKLFFKLAGAEFVSPEPLERIFGASETVEQIMVTGLATESRIAAVVVPARPEIEAESILVELQELARRHGLRSCEVPSAVVVAPRRGEQLPWTPANGLLTQSFKLNRPALQQRYRGELEQAYARASERAAPVTAGDVGVPVVERLRTLVAAVVRRPVDEVDLDGTFVDNGGTSLTAMELLLRLEEVFATKDGTSGVWEGEITDVGSVSLRKLAEQLDDRPAAPEPVVGTTPCERDRSDSGDDLDGDASDRPASAPATQPRQASAAPKPESPESRGRAESRDSAESIAALAEQDASWLPDIDPGLPLATAPSVLVTGATGLLGLHLLTRRLERPAGGQIFALVRAADHEAARQRLIATFERYALPVPPIGVPVGDSASERRGGIVAVAGHLDRERLGLDPVAWQGLARDIGLIYHCAAAVDHFAGYRTMREANVFGTRRLLKLATTTTLKAMHYVSTLNVAMILGQLGARRPYEELPLPDAVSVEIVRRNLGYAVTKLVGERLVRGLASELGERWPVSISRPAFISWSSETGCSNPEDWLSRLLDSALEVGAFVGAEEVGVPHWIPETTTSARGLELVPVDWAARAISRLGEWTRDRRLPPPTRDDGGGVATFHVTTTHHDEHGLVTLSRLMDLLALAHRRATGGALRSLPLAGWLLETEVRAAPFVPFARRLKRSPPALPRSECARFRAAVASLGATPAVDEELMMRYVARRSVARRNGGRVADD